ncbi:hypothetical protein [Corynebacterium accolens]|uniref:hypothetical protein n=1 Tax=Corynebacterium accolens TaxID=38284 RepID=UPI00266F67EE|nr:hypothetical protein [Corynebacterium accolens]WKS54928.1 hypothetical protein NLL31_06765 [Corynebacterium accolens]
MTGNGEEWRELIEEIWDGYRAYTGKFNMISDAALVAMAIVYITVALSGPTPDSVTNAVNATMFTIFATVGGWFARAYIKSTRYRDIGITVTDMADHHGTLTIKSMGNGCYYFNTGQEEK